MSTINQITLEVSQPTDTNVLNSMSTEGDAETSSVFSTLMDQHKVERQSGKKVKADGNEEPNHATSNKKENIESHQESEHDSVSEDKVASQTELQSTERTPVEDKKTQSAKADDENVAKDSTETDVAVVLDTKETTNLDNPEQLLSFLSVSEKVLVSKDQKVSVESAVNAENKASKASGSDVDLELASKEAENKKLIAKSLSADRENKDMKVSKQPNEKLSAEDKLSNLVKNTGSESAEVESDAVAEESLKETSQLASKADSAKSIEANTQVSNQANISTQSEDADSTQSTSEETVLVEELNSLSEEFKTESNKQQLAQPDLVVSSQTKQTKVNDANSIGDKKADFTGKVNNSNELLSQDISETVEGDVTVENNVKTIASVLPINSDQVSKKTKETSASASIKADQNVQAEESVDISSLSEEEILSVEPKVKASDIKLSQNMTPIASTLFKSELDSQSRLDTSTPDELSFENVMQTMSADLAQTQKNTVIQQTETISIMRKDFTDAVKEKVMVMISQKIQQIDIQLDPPELGNMQVRINIQNEQAVVNFVVQNQQAKDALEQNMDKLKHMMSESGVDVAGANVDQQSGQSSAEGQNEQGTNDSFNNDESSEAFLASENAKVIKASSTGVDYYV